MNDNFMHFFLVEHRHELGQSAELYPVSGRWQRCKNEGE